MKIVYLHGFGSNPWSRKVQRLREEFKKANVLAPSIPPYASKAYLELKLLIETTIQVDPDVILVGTSLGGFWANLFCRKYGLKGVVMNPVVYPHLTLDNEHAYRMVPDWSQTKIDEYEPYFDLAQYYMRSLVPFSVLLEEGDELLDHRVAAEYYENAASVRISQGGSHRFEDLNTLVQEIREIDNTECDDSFLNDTQT